jgi:pimeloyl-ACP methyl ester carboxylesterase
MEAVTVLGQTVALARRGEGIPFVFLHGLGADSGQCLTALAGVSSVDLICPDQPGHGRSSGSVFSFAYFADFALGLLDALGIEKAVFGGISMGAAVSLRVALTAPERVQGLVLVRPAWIDGAALPHLALVGRVGRWEDAAPGSAADQLAADKAFLAIARTNPAAAQSIAGLLTRPPPASAKVLSAMVHDRPFARLSDLEAITCPALVLANQDDPLHPVAVAHDIFGRLPTAHYQLVPSRYREPHAHLAALRSGIETFLRHEDLVNVHRPHHDRSHSLQAQGQG